MPSIENVTFTGDSGRNYTFTAWTTDTSFREIGGVYIFTKRDGHSYRALYVGETAFLGQRLSNHEQWPCVKKYGVDSICILLESHSRTRLEIERDIRETTHPPA